MNHGLRKHSKYGMSGLYRYSKCPGSVRLAQAVHRRDTFYSLDGTEAHELLDYALKNGYWDAEEASKAAGWYERDTREEAGARIWAVQVCLEYIWDILSAYDDAVLYVEHPFEFPSFVTDDCWGTCDICIHIPSLDLLYVIDYKHGAGVAVDIVTKHGPNMQTMGYATGAVEGSGHLQAETIMLAIVQPRAFHKDGPIRELAVSRQRLREFAVEVDMYIAACEVENAPLVPS